MERRNFLKNTSIVIVGGSVVGLRSLWSFIEMHRQICGQVFQTAVESQLHQRPIGEIVASVGRMFLGSAYEAHTLEKPGEEQLVINLTSFDCVTFIESSLALSRCIKNRKTTFDNFADELRFIRYRVGKIDGYESRLHYFIDWIYDNEQKGVLNDVSRNAGGEPYRKNINYMTSNRNRYPQLADDRVYRAIKEQENLINRREYYFLPKGNFHMYEGNVNEGDILAITTNIRGLDVIHTVIAVKLNGRVHVLHAPDQGKSVEITAKNLMDYMALNPQMTGVIVARPNDV